MMGCLFQHLTWQLNLVVSEASLTQTHAQAQVLAEDSGIVHSAQHWLQNGNGVCTAFFQA